MAEEYPWASDKFKYMTMDELVDIWERAGYVYEFSGEAQFTASQSIDTFFKAGARPVVIFSREVNYNGVGLNATVARPDVNSGNPGDYTGGTVVEIYNANDVNPQPNYASPTGEQEQGFVVIGGATTTGDWVQTRAPRPIFGSESNQSAGAPSQAISSPQFLKPFDLVRLRIENRDINNPQTISSYVRVAAPPDINDYIFDGNGAFVKYKGPISQITTQN